MKDLPNIIFSKNVNSTEKWLENLSKDYGLRVRFFEDGIRIWLEKFTILLCHRDEYIRSFFDIHYRKGLILKIRKEENTNILYVCHKSNSESDFKRLIFHANLFTETIRYCRQHGHTISHHLDPDYIIFVFRKGKDNFLLLEDNCYEVATDISQSIKIPPKILDYLAA